MKKRSLYMALLTASFSCILSMSPLAVWVEDQVGFWWKEYDGSYPVETWMWLDGNGDGISECYYFGDDGYLLTNTVTPDGYTVNKYGAWTIDGAVQVKFSGPGIELREQESAAAQTVATASNAVRTEAAETGTDTAQAELETETESAVETAASSESEALVYEIGGLSFSLSGEFEGGKVTVAEDGSLNIYSEDLTKMVVIMYTDFAEDSSYQSVSELAGEIGVALDSDGIKALILDTFIELFNTQMGCTPVSITDQSYPSGIWKLMRYDPADMDGTYTDVLLDFTDDKIFVIVIGGEGAYADVSGFMQSLSF